MTLVPLLTPVDDFEVRLRVVNYLHWGPRQVPGPKKRRTGKWACQDTCVDSGHVLCLLLWNQQTRAWGKEAGDLRAELVDAT